MVMPQRWSGVRAAIRRQLRLDAAGRCDPAYPEEVLQLGLALPAWNVSSLRSRESTPSPHASSTAATMLTGMDIVLRPGRAGLSVVALSRGRPSFADAAEGRTWRWGEVLRPYGSRMYRIIIQEIYC